METFFTKNIEIKFVIKFQKISSSRVIKIWYIENDNHILVIKIMDCKKYFLIYYIG